MYGILNQAVIDGHHVRFWYDGKIRIVYPLEIKTKGRSPRRLLYGYERSHFGLPGRNIGFRGQDQIKSFALDKIHSVEVTRQAI